MNDSIIYNLASSDKTLILGTRAPFLQSFIAQNWSDLRLTFAVSLTKESDPNDPTGLSEAIGASGEDNNQVYIGFKYSGDSALPPSSNFFGISTKLAAGGTSVTLQDGGQYLDFYPTPDSNHTLYASNGTTRVNNTPTMAGGVRMQDSLSGFYAGYAQLIMLRLRRLDPTSNKIDSLESIVTNSQPDHGFPFITDTTLANLRALTAAATFTPVIGPFTFVNLPDAIYCFWPFLNSRLRIHSYTLEKYG